MLAIVLDTNVYISSILTRGKARQILELIIEGKIDLVVSGSILNKLEEVLNRKKFGFPERIVQAIIREIQAVSDEVYPIRRIAAVTEDPDDDKTIECAVFGNADYIVSGDKHLLSLHKYRDIPIISPAEFLKILEELGIRKPRQ
ncbi:MAG: putative toxin-antitoxin system toxin component, PIN family [Proteobacteria bacterium]|nr:putative toxin-antitoxin system toxin component, PIN family [Pseudomonadota bacterium]